MSEKAVRYLGYVLKIGLFILPVLSLMVADSLFFPFISGKNFFFRIMVEILFFLWVFIACFDRDYLPKKSPIFIAIAATLFFLILSTVFGANPYRSFWSNFERMEGLIGHIHLFLYFLILTSALRKKEDWKWFFVALITVSSLITTYGFLQFFKKVDIHQSDVRLDATFGNATYLAIFLVFHLFLIALFFSRFKNLWIRIGLAVLFGLESAIIVLTATRGAILGTMGGIVVFTILMLIFTKNKKARYGAASALFALFAVVLLFVLFKNSSFVRTNYVLDRLAGLSISERTVESRLTIWKMSFNGFSERPFLGWGIENYNIVFNKYFEPKLWKQEPWFDRSHNIIFDWLISSGIMGFLAYWSIWGSAIFVLFKGYGKKYLPIAEVGLFCALFAAYAFHNLFVFDNLTSYFMFFSILGYLHFSYLGYSSPEVRSPLGSRTFKNSANKDIGPVSYAVITLTFVAVVFALYFANVKPILAGRQLINSLNQIKNKGADVNFTIKEFDKIFAYNSFASGESREQFSSYVDQIFAVPNISDQDKANAMARAEKEIKLQIQGSPDDARAYLLLTSLYAKSGRINDALAMANKALELSPKKQQIRFVVGDIYLANNQTEKAFEIIKETYELDPSYPEAIKNLALVAIINNKQDLAEKLLVDLAKAGITKAEIRGLLINAYARAGNFNKVEELWLENIQAEPNNYQYRVSLAATYLRLGKRNEAIKQLEKVIELNPAFKSQGQYFINEIKAGRNP